MNCGTVHLVNSISSVKSYEEEELTSEIIDMGGSQVVRFGIFNVFHMFKYSTLALT